LFARTLFAFVFNNVAAGIASLFLCSFDWQSFLRQKLVNFLNMWRNKRCSVDLSFVRISGAVDEDELHVFDTNTY
jgi:hypothetical protein